MASQDLTDHLNCILALLYPELHSIDRIQRLRGVLEREHARAHVSCFWYGKPGMHPPTIPEDVRAALARLPADIEEDFHTV